MFQKMRAKGLCIQFIDLKQKYQGNAIIEKWVSNTFLISRMASALGCEGYIECSAKTEDGLSDVFNTAIQSVMAKKSGRLRPKKRHKMCELL